MDPIYFTTEIDSSEINLVIKPESLEAQRRCDNEYSLAYVEAIQRGIPPRTVLEKMLRGNGMWTEKDDQDLDALRNQIVKLELELQEAKSLDEGLPTATQLAQLRGKLVEITQERGEVLNNSADFMAEQVRRDAFIAYSTFYADTNKRAFKDYNEFVQRAHEQLVLDARQAVARVMFKEFGDFMDALPESQYRVDETAIAEANKELAPARKAARKKTTRKKKAVAKKE